MEFRDFIEAKRSSQELPRWLKHRYGLIPSGRPKTNRTVIGGRQVELPTWSNPVKMAGVNLQAGIVGAIMKGVGPELAQEPQVPGTSNILDKLISSDKGITMPVTVTFEEIKGKEKELYYIAGKKAGEIFKKELLSLRQAYKNKTITSAQLKRYEALMQNVKYMDWKNWSIQSEQKTATGYVFNVLLPFRNKWEKYE